MLLNAKDVITYPSWSPRRQWIDSLRPKQNVRLFTDDTSKRIFLNENIRILTKNSLKFVPKGLINNIPALILIMAWRRPGDKPVSEPMLVKSLTHIWVNRPQWVKNQPVPPHKKTYRQTSNVRCTESKNLNVSHVILLLSFPNPLKNEDVVGTGLTDLS